MIHFTTVRVVGAITTLAISVLMATGCGVCTQDRPRPVDETSIQQPPATVTTSTPTSSTTSSPLSPTG